MGRLLVILGIVLIIVGLAWPWLQRPGLGRLPGDILVSRENFTFYLPITTMIVVSIVLSAIIWLINR